MEHIEQLKKIRAEAIGRLRSSADFKLAGKLGLLIVELGDTVDDTVDYAEPEEADPAPLATSVEAAPKPHPFEATFAKPKNEAFDDLTSDEIIDELVAEIEGDAAELDALAAAADDDNAIESEVDKIGPFLTPEVERGVYTNGSSH